MSKKFLFVFSLLILLIGALAGYYLLPQIFGPTKYSLPTKGWSTYVDRDHGVAIQYLERDSIYMQTDGSLSLSGLADTKPYIIRFEKVPYQNFQSWYSAQIWSGSEKDYIFATSTLGQPMIISDINEILYIMIRPGTLLTIENAKSSEGNYHSDKGLLEMATFDIRPVKIHADGFYVVES